MLYTFVEQLGAWGRIVTILMVLLLVFGSWRYLWQLFSISRGLRKASEQVRTDHEQRTVFPSRPRHLNELWTQFQADRAGTTVKVGDVEISTVDPEDVFTEHAVLEGYNRNMALAFAGMFTGLGILGTFLGLVVGLGSVDGTQQAQLMGSIMDLLGGMATAFYTSIAGIFLSLIWLFSDRALYHQVQRDAGRFFLAVRRAYPVESADRLLHRLLAVEQEESAAIHRANDILLDHGNELGKGNALLEEQKVVLQTLGTDLAIAFQDALSNSVGSQITPLLQGVIGSIEGLSTQMGERQVQLIGELVQTFQERLSSQLSGSFEHLSSSLRNAAEWQERVHGDLGQLIEKVQAATEGQREVLERSATACDLFQESLGGLTQSHQLIARSSEHLEGSTDRVIERLEEFGKRLTQQLETVAVTVGRDLERSAAMVDGMGEALTASIERIDLQARALEDRIAELDAQQETYRSANEEIRSQLAIHLDRIRDEVGSLQGFWTEFRNDLSGAGEGLKKSVTEISISTGEKLREIFARFDAEMAKVVEHLSGTLAEIREVTEELPGGVERLRGSLEDAVKPIAETGQTLRELPSNLKSVEELTAALTTLAPLSERIREAANQVNGTDRAILRLGEQLESTGNQFSVAISMFRQHGLNGEDRTPGRDRPTDPDLGQA